MADPNEDHEAADRPHGRDREEEDRPRRRRRRDDDFDEPPPRRGGSAPNGLATAGMILGIIALCMGPLAGIPALICGAIAMGRPNGRSAAVAGLVMGGIGTLITPFILIALLLPAVQKVREAAARQSDMNSMKQINLAMFGYSDANMNHLPPAETGVSWRVYLLPYLEQAMLYRQMDVTQPWNAPVNLPFAYVRVQPYVSVADPEGTVETHYRVFVGPHTLYEPGQRPLLIGQIPDGNSNTFFAIEAAETVPWSQPKELPYDRAGPLPALGVRGRKGFLVGMMDGSVRSVTRDVSDDMLRAGIEPNDGRFFNP